MQVVVCAIIDHVTQQATSKHARSGSCSSEELDKIPELDGQSTRTALRINTAW